MLSQDQAAFIQLNAFVSLIALHVCGAFRRTAVHQSMTVISTIGRASLLTAFGVLTFAFLSRWFSDTSRAWILSSWFAATTAVMLLHLGVSGLVPRLRQLGYLKERVAILGVGGPAGDVLNRFKLAPSSEISIVGLFDDRRTRLPSTVEGFAVLGDTDRLIECIRVNEVDRVLMTLPWTAEDRVAGLLSRLRQTPVLVDLVPHAMLWNLPSNVTRLHNVPVITVANHRVAAQLGLAKRLEDLVIAGLLVIALSPLLAAIAIAVKLESKGPILFTQNRFGFNNEVFRILKFRTMYDDRREGPHVRQASVDDPRVTRFGRILRRLSIDELPQLFNVITGDMSIVGPRPHAIPHNILYGQIIDDYFARHNVKPGITGWAQINGYRGETDSVEKMRLRVEHDLQYIQDWSLQMDLKIIIMTAFKVWFQKTAY